MPPMSKLKYVMKIMLDLARERPGRPQRRSLTNGLVIEIAQLPTGDVQLLLCRRDVKPGDIELATVLKHWPELVPPDVSFTARKEGKTYILVARWPRPVEVAA